MKLLFLFVGNIVFNTAGNVLMKLGMKNMDGEKPFSFPGLLHSMVFNPLLIIGVICYGLSLIFYLFILRKTNLSIAYPIVVSSTMLLVSMSSWIMKEAITPLQIAGCAIILCGIFMIVRV
jgi:multidrug transporter EmrE-like cation transporter